MLSKSRYGVAFPDVYQVDFSVFEIHWDRVVLRGLHNVFCMLFAVRLYDPLVVVERPLGRTPGVTSEAFDNLCFRVLQTLDPRVVWLMAWRLWV